MKRGGHDVRERTAPIPPRRAQRRALSHVGGAVELCGNDELERSVVAHALAVTADESSVLAHVHGFHSYPARLHPVTTARLIEAFSKPTDQVLDPFCGSGTVLVEARRLGRHAFGVDANPLAVELARLKTRSTTDAERSRWLDAAAQVADYAEERRMKRVGPTHRYPPADRELFDVHVLLELDGLRDGIKKLAERDTRHVLFLILSAMLIKVSRQPGDTAGGRTQRRLATGFTIRFFRRKAAELAQKSAEYTRLVPEGTKAARLRVGDARNLEPLDPHSMQLVLCSPPYPGVYDYSEQHAARLRWLGFDASALRKMEIGSRRRVAELDFDAAVGIWRDEFLPCLREMSRAVRTNGRVVVVMADSVLEGRALYADALVAQLGRQVGLELSSRGSQKRPYFHAPSAAAFKQRPRAEHVLVLRRKTRP